MTQGSFFHKPPSGHEFTDPILLEEFVKAGKAIFTLYSTRTTKHFTFKIIDKGYSNYWYVSRLASNGAWVYLGTIFPDERGFTFTKATSANARLSDQYRAFEWFWDNLTKKGRIHPQVKVYHEGRCGTCGTPLTDPESIKQGYGPECRKKKYRRPLQSDKVTT